MHRIFRVKAYEKEHGPHFNEEYARKAVMKMENEDHIGLQKRLPHWPVNTELLQEANSIVMIGLQH